jgi:hypothetical protein
MAGGNACPPKEFAMLQPLSSPQEIPAAQASAGRVATAIGIAAAVIATVVVIGAIALWAHYGTAVFFEMIVSGLGACF